MTGWPRLASSILKGKYIGLVKTRKEIIRKRSTSIDTKHVHSKAAISRFFPLENQSLGFDVVTCNLY